MQLIGELPFTSSTILWDTVTLNIEQLLSNAPISLWCSIIDILTQLSCTFVIQSHYYFLQNGNSIWPWEIDSDPSLEGLWDFSLFLQKFFQEAVLKYNGHIMILNTIIHYYSKVNRYLEFLIQPLFLVPSPTLVMAIISSGSVVLLHRLGNLFIKYTDQVKKVKTINTDFLQLKQFALGTIPTINAGVQIFMDCVITNSSFKDSWNKTFKHLLPSKTVKTILQCPNVRFFVSPIHGLTYCSLYATKVLENSIVLQNYIERKEIINEILQSLTEQKFDKILHCSKTFSNV